MIYSINPIFQSNIGSRGRASIGEPFVPGDAQNPANECSPTPSTRSRDYARPTTPPKGQQKPTDKSIQMSCHALESSKNSSNARTFTNAADPASPQATRQSTELIAPADATCADKPTAISVILPTTATDSERARAFWAKRANAKTPAAASAGPQTAEPPSITKSRAVRTMAPAFLTWITLRRLPRLSVAAKVPNSYQTPECPAR